MPPEPNTSPGHTVEFCPGEILLRLDPAHSPGILGGPEDFTVYLTRLEVLNGLNKNTGDPTKIILPQDAFNEIDKDDTLPGVNETWTEASRFYSKHLKSSIDAVVQIKCSTGEPDNLPISLEGRANLSSYYNEEGFSATIRKKKLMGLTDEQKKTFEASYLDGGIKNGKPKINPAGPVVQELTVIKPKPACCGDNDFLFDIDVTCRVLGAKIFNGEIKTGLVVIAGATGCGKSQVALGLVWKYIEGINKWKRRPHILTIEDPIENGYLRSIDTAVERPLNHKNNHARGFDYTPRNLRVDVVSLKQALKDAKRMTPAAVFIGETRDKEDWREVIDFAGSGHLILTTTHAGSLTETIQRIFSAIDAKTPAERGNAAQSLLAIVHIQTLALNADVVTPAADAGQNPAGTSKRINACVPALWMHDGGGAANLVADGLASIVPNNPPGSCATSGARGCLGRTWFAAEIKKQVGSRLNDFPDKAESTRHRTALEITTKNHWEALVPKTLESDLLNL